MAKLTLAACQFPVTGDPAANAGYVLRLMRRAARRGAHLAHFSECCLTGYPGIDFASTADIDWAALRRQTERVLQAAGELGLWVVVGSAHPLSGAHKPHNSLYVIDDRGRLVTRYDKLFCFGSAGPEPTLDFLHYSPGSEFITFDLRGVRVGLLICHDFRYPETYREYKRRGAQLVLHSFHNAGLTPAESRYYDAQVRVATQAAAAANFFWISVTNASQPQAHPSFVVDPTGMIAGRLRPHRPGVLITEIDTEAGLWDAAQYWRERAMAGVLHSGEAVSDPRSADRTSL